MIHRYQRWQRHILPGVTIKLRLSEISAQKHVFMPDQRGNVVVMDSPTTKAPASGLVETSASVLAFKNATPVALILGAMEIFANAILALAGGMPKPVLHHEKCETVQVAAKRVGDAADEMIVASPS